MRSAGADKLGLKHALIARTVALQGETLFQESDLVRCSLNIAINIQLCQNSNKNRWMKGEKSSIVMFVVKLQLFNRATVCCRQGQHRYRKRRGDQNDKMEQSLSSTLARSKL
jgi:hypothetical protein